MSDDDDVYRVPDAQIIPLRNGIDFTAEDEAERILAEDRRRMRENHVTPDYLTRDQELLRRSREVLGPYGVPDRPTGSSGPGMYRRTFNPFFGKRPVKLKQGDD